MPIPDFDENGLLPGGIHVCTLDEARYRFGRFQSTSRRPDLFAQLQSYLEEAKQASVVKAVVIDGSFVTAAVAPNDVDLVAVLADDYDFSAGLRPFQYNVLSNRRVRRRFGFDVLLAREDSTEYEEYVAFYQQVRGQPDLRKGVLRVEL